jgi:hypothetical protein
MVERGTSETYLGTGPGAAQPPTQDGQQTQAADATTQSASQASTLDGTYLGAPQRPAATPSSQAETLDGTYIGTRAAAPSSSQAETLDGTYIGTRAAAPSSSQAETLDGTYIGTRAAATEAGDDSHSKAETVPAGRSAIPFRTRLNETLPQDNRDLDVSLQLSRLSVFPEIATRSTDDLPVALRRRLEQLETHGRYSVRRFLAAGGMGAVLEIDDSDFGRRSAIKIIKPSARVHPGILERFIEEARITAQLEHPNIVPIHDLGVLEDGTVFFTMKFIQGMSLGQVVKKLKEGDAAARARWTESELLLTFLKVLDGLGFAHSRGVVHRDIKPDNIMIDGHGEVLVVDWGIAKALAGAGSEDADTAASTVVPVPGQQESLNATVQGTVMGSRHYMPMEQANGDLKAIDGRSDIYALGGTLYELLSLQRPRSGPDAKALHALAVVGRTTPLAEVAPNLHPDLAAIVTRALAPASADRYQTCEEFAADIRRYLDGKAVAARRRSTLEQAAAWISAHKVPVAVGSSALVLAVVAAGAGLHWADLRNRQQAESLTGRATTLLTGTPARPAVDEAIDLLTQAKALVAGDAAVAAALERARASQAELVRQEREATAAQARASEARTLAQRGRAHRDAGRFDDAERDLAAAFQLIPGDGAIDSDLRAVRRILDDRVQAGLRAAAQTRLDEGRQATTRARASQQAGDATGTDREIAAAAAAFTLAAKDGAAPSSLPEAVAELTTFRQEVAETRTRAAAAQAAIAAASTAVEAARAAEGERAQAARTNAEATAAVVRLTRELATASLDAKAPLWAAHQAQRASAEAAAAADTRVENHALAAWNGLAGLADHPLRAAAAALLADAYQRRAADAEVREDEAGIRTNRAALRRFDDGTRAAALDAPVALTMTGPSTRLTIRRLAPGPDTRLAPTGDPVATLDVPGTAKLPVGRYHLTSGDGAVASVYVRPGTPLSLPWQAAAPIVPGLTFAWVARPGGGFWLSTTEITQEQYRAFVLAPGNRALALDPVAALRRGENVELMLMPRTSPKIGVWTPVPATGAPTDLTIPAALAGTPVTNITRDDALAYAAWVSTSARVRARLPTAAEWEYAATAADPARIWPWGGVFDGAFAVTAQAGRNQPMPVAETTRDLGPFGHLGLAGNVREWLAPAADEAVGELTGAVAGGSWGDERPETFAGRYRERVPAEVLTPAIGFRLVVEETP